MRRETSRVSFGCVRFVSASRCLARQRTRAAPLDQGVRPCPQTCPEAGSSDNRVRLPACEERAKEFYVEKLGFDLTREDDSIPGIRWVQVTPRGGATSLTLVTWFESMPPGSLQGLVLVSDDLRGDCDRLLARGVEFERPLQEQPWGTEAVIRDPDGNKLVLQQA
jgi:catechol 2,3-dioxygenase-like lactoylglutathione lyase family enzyme